MLCVLTIPHSNAECERVFSSVRKTITEFRNWSSLSDENLENVLICESMQKGHCCQQKFDKEFLTSATYNNLRNKNESRTAPLFVHSDLYIFI